MSDNLTSAELYDLAFNAKSPVLGDEDRESGAVEVLHLDLFLKQRQTIALERIADLLDGTTSGICVTETLLGSSVRR